MNKKGVESYIAYVIIALIVLIIVIILISTKWGPSMQDMVNKVMEMLKP